jgi:hypothetical protein
VSYTALLILSILYSFYVKISLFLSNNLSVFFHNENSLVINNLHGHNLNKDSNFRNKFSLRENPLPYNKLTLLTHNLYRTVNLLSLTDREVNVKHTNRHGLVFSVGNIPKYYFELKNLLYLESNKKYNVEVTSPTYNNIIGLEKKYFIESSYPKFSNIYTTSLNLNSLSYNFFINQNIMMSNISQNLIVAKENR